MSAEPRAYLRNLRHLRPVPIAGALVLATVVTIVPTPIHAQPSGSPPPASSTSAELVVDLPTASRSDRQRVSAAAREAIDRLTEWLGPCPETTIAIGGRPFRPGGVRSHVNVELDVPWRSAPETMDLESQVAFGIARSWWPMLTSSAETSALRDGIAWYLQSRVVDRLYDFNFQVPAHSAAGVRYFGGAWPWTFRILPLSRWSSGLGREEYLRSRINAAAGPGPARRLYPGVGPAVFRSALAFATLERYLGWPTLQGALSVGATTRRPLTRDELQQTIESAVGQDLSWFFGSAFETTKTVDYGISEFTTGEISPCGSGPCFRTRVTIVRNGSGEFANELQVRFADGQQVSARWDGRDSSRTFEFDSVAPAAAAVVDPGRTLLLDENDLNNERRHDAAGSVAVRKWVGYWLVWLEGAVLDYGVLF